MHTELASIDDLHFNFSEIYKFLHPSNGIISWNTNLLLLSLARFNINFL